VFGSYQDVVKLTPMERMTATDLKLKLFETINIVQGCGFTVSLAVIADNNGVNRKVYHDLLTQNKTYIDNPDHVGPKIFFCMIRSTY
jgi:hypothetical protein